MSLHQHAPSQKAFRQGVSGEEIYFGPETPLKLLRSCSYNEETPQGITFCKRRRDSEDFDGGSKQLTEERRLEMLRQLETMQELCIAAGGNFSDGVT